MTAAGAVADEHVYVYGIARTGSAPTLSFAGCEGVVPGRPVKLVPFRGLAVIVSAFPPDAAEPEPGDGQSERAKQRAIAHHRVLAELTGRFPLAPAKFGTVLRDLDSLMAFAEQNAAALDETLDRVAGCREWGLKLVADPSIALAAAQSLPSLAPLQEELASASEGKAFFVRKKLKLAQEAEARQMLAALGTEVHEALRKKARGGVHVSNGSTAARKGPILLLNTAYLVETAAEAVFHGTLETLRSSFQVSGLSGRVTGPWPPYNFASLPSRESTHV
jgi:hypothetical protein